MLSPSQPELYREILELDMRHGPMSMGEVIFIMNSPQEECVQHSYMFVCEISSISRHFKENMKIKLLTLCNSRMMFSVQISKGT